MKLVPLALALSLTFGLAGISSAQLPPQPKLEGLWTASLRETGLLHGPMTISCRSTLCRARIDSQTAQAVISHDKVRFRFVGGTFDAHVRHGRLVESIWTQPPAPESLGAADRGLASPVRMRRAASGSFVGQVVPFVHALHFFLRLERTDQGQLVAALRNPELNETGGAAQFAVTVSGDAIRLKGIARNAFVAGRRRSSGEILLRLPGGQDELAFHRASDDEARRFYPKPAGSSPYHYRPPPRLSDGWKVTNASNVGFDTAALSRLVSDIATEDPAGPRPDLVHSLLIARNGRLILEEYFYGFDRDTPQDLRSASKTFASVLVGTERLRGVAIGPSTLVYPAVAALGPFANFDARKNEITLAELMTHTSGLACDDNDDASPGNEGRMQSQTRQPDWWKYTLDLPMTHQPGTRYAYCSANINLVGAVLHQATGMTIPELFDRDMAEPLGFGQWYWNLMPTGEGYLGGGAKIRSRDLLKVGESYLDGGTWNGRQLVSAHWASLSTRPRVQINPTTTGLSKAAFDDSYVVSEDGLAWHETSATSGGKTYKGYAAGGNGGQLLLVFPELDMVVVVTGGNYGQFNIWGSWTQKYVGDGIIGALRAK